MAKNDSGSGGIGFCSLLTILFIGLRLAGFVDWPWWQVLAPMWVSFVVCAVVFVVALVAMVVHDEG